MTMLSAIWNIILVGGLVLVLAVAGLMIDALVIPPRDDRTEQLRREAELWQAQEQAEARRAHGRGQALGQWADEQADQEAQHHHQGGPHA